MKRISETRLSPLALMVTLLLALLIWILLAASVSATPTYAHPADGQPARAASASSARHQEYTVEPYHGSPRYYSRYNSTVSGRFIFYDCYHYSSD